MDTSPAKMVELQLGDIEVRAVVGLYPHERAREQTLILSAACVCDVSRTAVVGGRVSGGLDYAELARFLQQEVVSGRFELLEDLLETVGKRALEKYPTLLEGSLSVRKPAALPGKAWVGMSWRFKR